MSERDTEPTGCALGGHPQAERAGCAGVTQAPAPPAHAQATPNCVSVPRILALLAPTGAWPPRERDHVSACGLCQWQVVRCLVLSVPAEQQDELEEQAYRALGIAPVRTAPGPHRPADRDAFWAWLDGARAAVLNPPPAAAAEGPGVEPTAVAASVPEGASAGARPPKGDDAELVGCGEVPAVVEWCERFVWDASAISTVLASAREVLRARSSALDSAVLRRAEAWLASDPLAQWSELRDLRHEDHSLAWWFRSGVEAAQGAALLALMPDRSFRGVADYTLAQVLDCFRRHAFVPVTDADLIESGFIRLLSMDLAKREKSRVFDPGFWPGSDMLKAAFGSQVEKVRRQLENVPGGKETASVHIRVAASGQGRLIPLLTKDHFLTLGPVGRGLPVRFRGSAGARVQVCLQGGPGGPVILELGANETRMAFAGNENVRIPSLNVSAREVPPEERTPRAASVPRPSSSGVSSSDSQRRRKGGTSILGLAKPWSAVTSGAHSVHVVVVPSYSEGPKVVLEEALVLDLEVTKDTSKRFGQLGQTRVQFDEIVRMCRPRFWGAFHFGRRPCYAALLWNGEVFHPNPQDERINLASTYPAFAFLAHLHACGLRLPEGCHVALSAAFTTLNERELGLDLHHWFELDLAWAGDMAEKLVAVRRAQRSSGAGTWFFLTGAADAPEGVKAGSPIFEGPYKGVLPVKSLNHALELLWGPGIQPL